MILINGDDGVDNGGDDSDDIVTDYGDDDGIDGGNSDGRELAVKLIMIELYHFRRMHLCHHDKHSSLIISVSCHIHFHMPFIVDEKN